MKYNKLEQEILRRLRDGGGLAYPATIYPFKAFYENVKEVVKCSEDELAHAIKILHVEGLLEANLDHESKVLSLKDITQFGLIAFREISQEQEPEPDQAPE